MLDCDLREGRYYFQAECRVFDSRPPLQTWFILKEKPLIFQSFSEKYPLSTPYENLTPHIFNNISMDFI